MCASQPGRPSRNRPQSPNFWALALNIYAENLFKMSVILINTFMISRIDVLLLAATSAANQLFMLFGVFFTLTSVGASVLTAQSLGARKQAAARFIFGNALAINLALAGTVLALLLGFCTDFLRALNTPEPTIAAAAKYLQFMSYSICFDALSWLLSATLRARGLGLSLTLVAVGQNLLTTALNAVFLYGLFGTSQLGLLGVGLANLLARAAAAGAYIFIYFFIAQQTFSPTQLRPSGKICARMLQIGGFSAASGLANSLQYLCIFSIIASLGAAALATQTMYFQISYFIFAPAAALSAALQITCAHSVGQGAAACARRQVSRVLRLCAGANLLAVLIACAALERLVSALNFSPQMAQIAASLMAISLFLEPLRGANFAYKAAFTACARTRLVFAINLLSRFAINLPIAYFCAPIFGLFGVWLGFLCDEIFYFFASVFVFKRQKFLFSGKF